LLVDLSGQQAADVHLGLDGTVGGDMCGFMGVAEVGIFGLVHAIELFGDRIALGFEDAGELPGVGFADSTPG
jgi:hypothetical protein